MVNDHNIVWENCLKTIRGNISPQSFKTWFEPIKPIRLENEALTIQVPNKIFYEWLEEHYVGLLKSTIRQEIGQKAKLEYQIPIGKTQETNISARKPTHNTSNTAFVAADHIKNPFVIPGIKKVKIDPQ
ncbi:MAG TPA: DnaA N-terminal domain-containing protein, partial [Saprospiraceae bacterium]|nr:DnaA N-terminal domain-containing protein [Saprospiraceae bacterium]